jgi:hypothetical protein
LLGVYCTESAQEPDFGKDQGVAASYTFRDERDLLWYSTVFTSGGLYPLSFRKRH